MMPLMAAAQVARLYVHTLEQRSLPRLYVKVLWGRVTVLRKQLNDHHRTGTKMDVQDR